MVGPGRKVDIISDRHQGILNAVREQIEGMHLCTIVGVLGTLLRIYSRRMV